MLSNEDSTFSFSEGCLWSWCRPVQISRSNWGLEGVGKFCGNGETGESQRRRRIPKSAASGQILQIGGNGEGPRRAVGENGMSCPRLSSLSSTPPPPPPPPPLTNPADRANQTPYWGKSHLGVQGSQTRLGGRFEDCWLIFIDIWQNRTFY